MSPALHFELEKKIPGLAALTTTRSHNLGMNTSESADKVLASRQALWKELGLDLARTVFLRQVHADRLEAVGKAEWGRGVASWDDAIADCDLAIAKDPGTLLAVGHADCLAVVLVDPVKKICGAAHAGWRGAVAQVATKLGQAMVRDFHADPAQLLAGLSVCLGPCHLELSDKEFSQLQGRPGCGPLKDGHFKFDLRAHAQDELMRLGLQAQNIEVQAACTWDANQDFFSHRAEKGEAGRQMTVIGFVS